MKTVIDTQPFYNSSGKKILEYVSPTEIHLNLLFILTVDKRLSINMPYMKVENKLSSNDITSIKLLNFEVSDGFIQLGIQELESKKAYSLSWDLNYEGSY